MVEKYFIQDNVTYHKQEHADEAIVSRTEDSCAISKPVSLAMASIEIILSFYKCHRLKFTPQIACNPP